jgi:hypothetical protein
MIPHEHQETLARLLAGDPPDEAALQSLRAACKASPELLNEIADQTMVDRLLCLELIDKGSEKFAAEVIERLSRGEAGKEEFARRVIGRLYWQRYRFLAAAAAVFLALAAWWMWRPVTVGSLAGTASAAWMDGGELAEGVSLKKGQRLRLASGFASIRFAQGAEVVLEGAADFEITGPNQATLHLGNVTASVPESAHGFTIDGPDGRVVDLGTRFGVRVSNAGMEVHVLEGKVEAHPERHSLVALEKDEALRFDRTSASPIPPEPLAFLTALPPKHLTLPPWLLWPLDEGNGDVVSATGHGFDLDSAMGRLTSLPGGSVLPAWVPGVRGTAISLHGQNDYVQTGFSGISGSRARTVACWVQVPRDMNELGYALVSWGAHQQPGDTWQVSINPELPDGPPGRLRVGTHRGRVVGTTDLRDGRWHHVAVVLYEGSPANVATHILLYVDGKLEPAALKAAHTIDTDTASDAAQHVAFGKNTAIRSADDPRPAPHTFRGQIDEVFVCAGALSEQEIRHLIDHGAPR